MSVKIMGAVWDADIPKTWKLVLLAYADYAAHDGTGVYPSVGRVAWKTGYCERSVQQYTKEMVDARILVPDGRHRFGMNVYRIDVSALPERPDYSIAGGVQDMQGGAGLAGVGVQSTAEGGAGAAPNPLVEPSEETSENTLACDQKRLPAGVLLRGPDEQEDSPAAEEFDEMFPRKYDVPKTESTLAKDLQTQEGRDRIIANNAAYWQKKKETSDWLDWHPQRFHPRGGISKESIQRVSWLVNKITGIEPRSDQQWDRWRSSCEAMYKEAEGDFEIIEQAIKLKWPDEVQYRSSTPEKYVEAVVKVMAGGVPKPKTRRAF